MAVIAFVIAHMQDVAGWLAPTTAVLFGVSGMTISTRNWRVSREVAVVLALLIYLVLNSALNQVLAGVSLVGFIRQYGQIYYTLGLFLLASAKKPSPRFESALSSGLILGGLLNSVLSLYSYFVSPLTIGQTKLTSGTMILGLLGGHNPVAGSLGLVIIFLVISLNEGYGKWLKKSTLVQIVALATIGLTFLLAQSRGYTIALIVAVGLYLVRSIAERRSWRSLLVGAAVIVVLSVGTILALWPRFQTGLASDPNVVTRMLLWQRAWDYFTQSPMTGLGLGSFRQDGVTASVIVPGLLAAKTSGTYLEQIVQFDAEGGLHAHNVFLQLLAETGLIGLALLVALFALGVHRYIRLRSLHIAQASPEFELYRAAILNGKVFVFVLVYLSFAGLTAGYTYTSPTMAWLLYVSFARMITQHRLLTLRASEDKRWGVFHA